MKKFYVIMVLVSTLFMGVGSTRSVQAEIYTNLDNTSYITKGIVPTSSQTLTATTQPYDSNTVILISSPTNGTTISTSTSYTDTIAYDPNSIYLQSGTGNTLHNTVGTNTISTPSDNQLPTVQGGTLPNSTSQPQQTYYYGPPQLSSSNPLGGDGISGHNFKFGATIADPNNLVGNVRFKSYDTNGNLLLDTDSTLNENGTWIANTPFDSNNYPDGYGYKLEIITEGSSAGSITGRGYTLSSDSIYFGIDNVKSLDISTYPDVDGTTIINKEFIATAYHPYENGAIPVASTTVQFYFVDSQRNRIEQAVPQTMTKDPSPYNNLWSSQSLDSRTLFSKGNGHYVAVFTSLYADGATIAKETSFEVYNSNDVTPPNKPVIKSPANGITMKPGIITYSWTGNKDDDVVAGEFERGSIETDGSFIGRAGGPIPREAFTNGTFTWTFDFSDQQSVSTTNWHIRVKDRAGNWSDWSNVFTYTIDPNYVPDTTPPPKPTLTSPLNNQNINGSKLVQTWKSEANDIDYYVYESYKDSQRNTLTSQEKLTANNRTPQNISNGAFWWRVQAVDKSGNKSEWSDLFKITISNVTLKK